MTTDPIQARRRELGDLLQALRPAPIDPDDSRYFAFHEAAGDPRGADPVARLRSTVELSRRETTCQIFSGFRGTGKSSELRRLRADLVADGFEVLVVEAEKVINLYKPVEPSDLLLSVAAAVATELEARFGENPADRGVGERIVEFFQRFTLSQVELGSGFEAGAARIDLPKLTFNLAKNPSFKAQVQEALRGKLTEFVRSFQEFMGKAREALAGRSRRPCPVLIIDDLEKVTGLGEEQDLVQRSIQQIFWEFHWALRIDGWHCIWAAPPYLQLLNSSVDALYDGSVVLPMVRVWSKDDARSEDSDGIAALRRCMMLRGNIESLFFRESSFDQLVQASSGHIRELMALLRECVLDAYQQEDITRPLNEAAVERLIANYTSRRQISVYAEDVPLLHRIAETRALSLDDRRMASRVAELLDSAVVMTFQNGSMWFDVSTPVRRLFR